MKKEKYYIKDIEFDKANLHEGCAVGFILYQKHIPFEFKTIVAEVCRSGVRDWYYLSFRQPNDIIFDLCGIKRIDFMKNTLGYDLDGIWPYVRNLDDLKTQLQSLLYYEEF
jgi:hypothetical protein